LFCKILESFDLAFHDFRIFAIFQFAIFDFDRARGRAAATEPVGSVIDKLDAIGRTDAVAHAARLGIIDL
jgi:hypothetical protein